ncbi:hypothetical protein CO151_14355 [bacterium CG_4_9_14_3_um_filter_65_15]|nr:MAG: hypothetical protein CO151_14355 [bacterium CG_4_9_14_3_um_filter_65_15]
MMGTILFACAMATGSSAQSDHTCSHFRPLPPEQRVVQNSVRGIAQDNQGFLWIATLGGVHRFDGQEMLRVNTELASNQELDLGRISFLTLDSGGNLWLAGPSGSLDRIRYADGKPESFTAALEGSGSGPGWSVWQVEDLGTGRLVLLADGRLFLLDPDRMETRALDVIFPAWWKVHGLRRILALEGDRLLTYNEHQLGVINLAEGTLDRIFGADSGPLPKDFVCGMGRMRDGSVWVCGTQGRVGEVGMVADHVQVTVHQLPVETDLRLLSRGLRDEFWLVGSGDELLQWQMRSNRVTVHELDRDGHPMPGDQIITELLVDRSGVVWVGTEGYGVFRFDPSSERFQSMTGHDNGHNGFSDPYLWDIREDSTGIIIAGRGEFGRMDPRNHQYQALLDLKHDPRCAELGDLFCVLPLDGGAYLLGTKPHNLVRYDPAAGTLTPVNGSGEALGEGIVPNVLERDEGGSIWVFGIKETLLLGEDAATWLPVPPTLAQALDGVRVRCLAQAPDGVRFFGTETLGVLRWDPQRGALDTWQADADSSTLPHNGVRSLHLDDGGTLWIGSYGGLSRLDDAARAAPGAAVATYTTADGLPDNTIYSILPEKDGALWLATNLGLCRFDPADAGTRNFNLDDGMANNEFNGGASLVGSDGTLYLGGVNGLTWFRPSTGYLNRIPPKAALTHVKVGGKPLGNPLTLTRLDHLVVPWRHNSLEFNLAALCFQQPDRQRARYRIDGVTDDWWEVSRGQPITLIHLPFGDRRLEYRVSNNDGLWSPINTLSLHVATPPWQQWWAWAIYAIVVGGAIWLIVRLFRRRQVRSAAHASRLAQADKLKAVGQLAAGLAHDFNNHLQIIMSSAELASQELEPGHPGQQSLRRIVNTGRRAGLLSARLLTFAKESDPGREDLDLDEVVTNLRDLITSFLGASVEFVCERQPGVKIVHANREQIEQVLLNLCVNARDASTSHGRIEIGTSVVEEGGRRWCLCEVRDNGAGIPEGLRRKVFEPFFSTKPNGEGTGLGLSMVKRIVSRHGGRIELSDNEMGGTTMGVLLPCATAEVPASPPAPALAPDPATAPRARTVLVADDEEIVNRVTTAILERAGFTVLSAHHGREAVAMLEQHPEIALIVLDVIMPVMGGREVYEYIHEHALPMAVIMCSGQSFSALEGADLAAAGVPVLSKPYTARQLLDAVERLLGKPTKVTAEP